MKMRLSPLLLSAALIFSINLFGQNGSAIPKRNFLAIDIAQFLGVELEDQQYSRGLGLSLKRQINEKYRLRTFFEQKRNTARYGSTLFVFNDTIFSFNQRHSSSMKWLTGLGIERTKRYGICEVYYGLQLHVGKEKREVNSEPGITYGPEGLQQALSTSYADVTIFNSNYQENQLLLLAHMQHDATHVGLGIPIGFGVDLFRHLGLQAEITPGIQLNRSIEKFDYISSGSDRVSRHTTITLNYIGFQILLGWKFG